MSLLKKPNGRRRWRKWLARERKRGNDPAASWGLCKEKTGLARKAQGKSWAGADLPELRAVPLPSPPWSARLLVGATMGARKRAVARMLDESKCPEAITDFTERFQWYLAKGAVLLSEMRIGERLRLCPGCPDCCGFIRKELSKEWDERLLPRCSGSEDQPGVVNAVRDSAGSVKR